MTKTKVLFTLSILIIAALCIIMLHNPNNTAGFKVTTIPFSDIILKTAGKSPDTNPDIAQSSGLMTPPDSEKQIKTLHTFDSVEEYAAVSSYGPMPEFLSDLGFDGGIDVDDAGALIISHDIRLLFDFFLAAIRTEGMDQCTARAEEYIDLTLPPDAANDARSILSSYVTYKQKMKTLYQDFSGAAPASPDEYRSLIQKTLKARNAIRRECMTEDIIQAFFLDEESYDTHALSTMNDKS